jgi:hypothetical protein
MFQRQVSWLSEAVAGYHVAAAALEESRADFLRVLSTLFGGVDDALHAAAREVHACSSELVLPYHVPDVGESRTWTPAELALRYDHLSAEWQSARMSLDSHLRRTRRSLDRLEVLLEQQARLGNYRLVQTEDASRDAALLLQAYAESATALADFIEERYLALGLTALETAGALSWELASPIQSLNLAFVALNDRSLQLRIRLLHGNSGEWRAEHKLASALGAASHFQWDQVRPRLNGVLVHTIAFLIGPPEPRWLGPLAAQRPEWEKLVTVLRTVQIPRSSGAS